MRIWFQNSQLWTSTSIVPPQTATSLVVDHVEWLIGILVRNLSALLSFPFGKQLLQSAIDVSPPHHGLAPAACLPCIHQSHVSFNELMILYARSHVTTTVGSWHSSRSSSPSSPTPLPNIEALATQPVAVSQCVAYLRHTVLMINESRRGRFTPTPPITGCGTPIRQSS